MEGDRWPVAVTIQALSAWPQRLPADAIRALESLMDRNVPVRYSLLGRELLVLPPKPPIPDSGE